MKYNIRHYFHLIASVIAMGGTLLLATGCEDDDMSKSKPDYDPRYKGAIGGFGTADYNLESNVKSATITFNSDMAWTAAIIDSEGNACQWASISPENGEAGEGQAITVTLQENEDISNSRTATVTISTEKELQVRSLLPRTIKCYILILLILRIMISILVPEFGIRTLKMVLMQCCVMTVTIHGIV